MTVPVRMCPGDLTRPGFVWSPENSRPPCIPVLAVAPRTATTRDVILATTGVADHHATLWYAEGGGNLR
jgi:hypothetical protein